MVVKKIKNITNIITLKNNVPILASKLAITKIKINNPIKILLFILHCNYEDGNGESASFTSPKLAT